MNIDLTSLSSWVTIIGTIVTGLGGAYVTIRKVISSLEKSKKKHAIEILKIAKDNNASIKLQLEAKINELESKFHILKENVEKDLSHLKQSYESEIRFLGQKIELLREEVHDQHGQLVQLLTKMIGKD